jgi:2',3'-cyclic-nucleotide 2'-phosphodiesterase
MPVDASFRILALGDVIGKPGRKALGKHLARIVTETGADFVVVNGENAAGGLGITPEIVDEFLKLPIDVITSGNHIWKHKEITDTLNSSLPLLRPANYPLGTPGRGAGIFRSKKDISVGVINLEGLLFMSPLSCPFHTADHEIDRLKQEAEILLVDFHAEATSEKRALGHYLDGRISALVGTHTHVPTADAEILPGGTGYLTDLGMCGAHDSVIGIRKQDAIRRFLSRMPTSFQVAEDDVRLQGALIDVDPRTGRCLDIAQKAWKIED